MGRPTFRPTKLTRLDADKISKIKRERFSPAQALEDIVRGTESLNSSENTGFTSTKQLNVDFSRFENHTFFSSAEQNTNVAFSKMLSTDEIGYPYYGTYEKYQEWYDGLTGFENFIFKLWPKVKGFLYLDGTSYLNVTDTPNALLAAERIMSGQGTVNPKTGSMTVEFHLNPLQSAPASVVTGTILNFMDSDAINGYQINLITSASNHFIEAKMLSGSREESVSFSIPSSFQHYACIFNRERELDQIKIYANGLLSGSSNRYNEIGSIPITNGKIYIGTNSTTGGLPSTQYLSASIDEMRIWSKVRTPEELAINSIKTIRAQDNLELYYTFNIPNYLSTETDAVSRSIYEIDLSGNEIHGQIVNYITNNRQTSGSAEFGNNPMIYETPLPVLMSDHPSVEDLYQYYMNEAIQYDLSNPSLITKLIPPAILEMSKTGVDRSEELAARVNKLSQYDTFILGITDDKSSDVKGILEAFLYVLAKFFDELKIFIDQYKNFNSNSYIGARFPDKMLDRLLRQYGIDLTGIFNETSLDKFLRGENIEIQGDVITDTLQDIRSQIWRRIMNNVVGLMKGKGTREAIEGMFRLIGIDPDTNFKIKEFGGFNQTQIQNRFVNSAKVTPFIDLSSGSNGFVVPVFNVYNTSIKSPSDGFHFEYLIKTKNNQGEGDDTSLGRLFFRNPASGTFDVFSNVVLYSSFDGDPRIEWEYMPTSSSLGPVRVSLTGTFYDGNIYRLAYGRKNLTSGTFSSHSSSYYMSLTPVEFDNISGSYYSETSAAVNQDYLYSGYSGVTSSITHYLCFGENPLETLLSTPEVYNTELYYNKNLNYSIAEIHSYETHFYDIPSEEIHRKNPFSIAMDDSALDLAAKTYRISSNVSYNQPHGKLYSIFQFDQASGSVSGSTMLPISENIYSGINGISFTNFAQTNYYNSSTNVTTYENGFISSSIPVGTDPRFFETIYYKQLTTDWDRFGSNSADRIRIYTGEDAINPSPELYPTYDPRLSLDFSIADTLNQDIILIISSLDKLGNAISTYKNRFSYDFKELENLRKIYFKRIEDKVNFKEFFKFFRYFDENLVDFILPIIPARIEFLGGRFVVENHMLERSKFVYKDYNGLFSSGKSPREIRAGAGVPVLEGSISPVASEPGGVTMGYYHCGGAKIQGLQRTARSLSSGQNIYVNSVRKLAGDTTFYTEITGSDGIVYNKSIDYDEAMPFSWNYRIFEPGNSEFIRILFDEQDLEEINFPFLG